MAQGWLPVFPTQQQRLCLGPGPASEIGFLFLVVGLVNFGSEAES